ncbi:portal protein [Klebsiella phage vB_KmiS-Kmi2C]|nr:portal protein [Klebsiella phage vB_KmiS-Kmi2C]
MSKNVAFIRKEVRSLMPLYKLIRDCLSGSETVKERGKQYLPMPNPTNQSPENIARYEQYLKRAVFYNVTRRTLIGLVGQVFNREPIVNLPVEMEPIINNATGGGVTLNQLSKKSLSMTLAYSRSGIFVDYPTTEEGATVEDLKDGGIRPTINVYSPLEIINWRIVEMGAEERLSLVVLAESFCYFDDGFERKDAPQFRVLYLDKEGNYNIDIYREANSYTDYKEDKKYDNTQFKLHTSLKPRGPDGKPLKFIPFMFVGSENNDSNPDNPNFYDLADLNIAHYRNSADYEESCFIVGQPTPVVTGLTQTWYEDVLDKKINFGSIGGVPLGENMDLKLVQAVPNTMIKEAMEIKERQMVALGAKLVEQKQVQRTAFEAKVENIGENSTLGTVTKNVNEAIMWALEQCAMYMNIKLSDKNEYVLNTDFDISKTTPEERNQIIDSWVKGAISWSEMRVGLRRAGTATEDDDKAKQEILSDKKAQAELVQKTAPSANDITQ